MEGLMALSGLLVLILVAIPVCWAVLRIYNWAVYYRLHRNYRTLYWG
jgi:hypothetical protein